MADTLPDPALPQISQPWPSDNHMEKLNTPFSASNSPGSISFPVPQTPSHTVTAATHQIPSHDVASAPTLPKISSPPPPPFLSSHLHGDSSMTNDTLSASDSGAQFPLPLTPYPTQGFSADWMQTNSARDSLKRFPEARVGSGLNVFKKKKKYSSTNPITTAPKPSS